LAFALVSCTSSKKVDYTSLKACQDYSIPEFKFETPNKVVLFVFPHPDDEIVCAGTALQLQEKGWETHLLTLTKGSSEEKKTRFSEWQNATRQLKFSTSEIYDLINNNWDDVLKNKIQFWYTEMDSVKNVIYTAIRKYNPSVVITYDSALGGYGHPEHRISAIQVARLFSEKQNDSSFSVKCILQITLPEKMEKKMLSNSEPYLNAIKNTGNLTLPQPTYAFDIFPQWSLKNKAALCYKSQLNTLKKFNLVASPEDSLLHYKTFDREYFKEIK
jgi:LmbE family N-acetylglucosaminyl deacetylase